MKTNNSTFYKRLDFYIEEETPPKGWQAADYPLRKTVPRYLCLRSKKTMKLRMR